MLSPIRSRQTRSESRHSTHLSLHESTCSGSATKVWPLPDNSERATARQASASHPTANLQAQHTRFSGEKRGSVTSLVCPLSLSFPHPYQHQHGCWPPSSLTHPCAPGTRGCSDFLFLAEMEEHTGKCSENHKALCNLHVALSYPSKNREQKIPNIRQDSLKWVSLLQYQEQARIPTVAITVSNS